MQDILTRRDKLTMLMRDAISVLPKLGLVNKPHYHKDGVSFVVAVKDEENWIAPCLSSIIDVADEIIVVDGSVKDHTTEIVSSYSKQNSKIKHIRFYHQGPNAFALSLHIGLSCVSYKWVFKWDGDMIAKDSASLKTWLERLQHLDKNRYHVIDVSRINLEGDLKHQPKTKCFGEYEGRLFTWSPDLKWVLQEGSYEHIVGDNLWGCKLPPWFQVHRWHEPFIFHCNIKSSRQMLMRLFWADYMNLKENCFSSLENYVAYRVQNDWGMTLEQAEKKVVLDAQKNLALYDEQRFGALPKALWRLQVC